MMRWKGLGMLEVRKVQRLQREVRRAGVWVRLGLAHEVQVMGRQLWQVRVKQVRGREMGKEVMVAGQVQEGVEVEQRVAGRDLRTVQVTQVEVMQGGLMVREVVKGVVGLMVWEMIMKVMVEVARAQEEAERVQQGLQWPW
jgi:hypothetical protein